LILARELKLGESLELEQSCNKPKQLKQIWIWHL